MNLGLSHIFLPIFCHDISCWSQSRREHAGRGCLPEIGEDSKIDPASKRENTRHSPMLFQCWPSVEDAGPTLKQNWVNVPVFAGKRENFINRICGEFDIDERPAAALFSVLCWRRANGCDVALTSYHDVVVFSLWYSLLGVCYRPWWRAGPRQGAQQAMIVSGSRLWWTLHWQDNSSNMIINPYSPEIFVWTMEIKGFSSIWNHHKCLSYIFPLHLNFYVMGLRPL